MIRPWDQSSTNNAEPLINKSLNKPIDRYWWKECSNNADSAWLHQRTQTPA